METVSNLSQAKADLKRAVDRITTVSEALEIRQLIADYYARKVDKELDKLWEDGTIDAQTIEKWSHEHMRTPYK